MLVDDEVSMPVSPLDARADPSPSVSRLALASPLLGYGAWLAGAAFAPPNPLWAFALLVWAATLTLFVARALPRVDALLEWIDRRAAVLAIAAIVLFAVAAAALNILQAHYFALGERAQDTAYNSQILWNTLHGHFLKGNLNQESLYRPPVANELALHVSPALLLVLLPAYFFQPHFLTLLVVRDLALAFAAWPLFLLTQDSAGRGAAFTVVLLYLTHPAVVAQVFQEFSLLQLAPLPLFFASRAFFRNDFRTFVPWFALALSVREDVAIVLAGFGLLALLERRQLRWSALTTCAPLAWWIIATHLIQPAFGRAQNSAIDLALAGGTRSLSAGLLAQLLAGDGLEYVYHLLLPVAFLPLFAREGVLALPGLAAAVFLLHVYPLSGTGDPTSRFALLPSCFLLLAGIAAATRFGRTYGRAVPAFGMLFLLLFVSPGVLDGLKDTVQLRLIRYSLLVPNDPDDLRSALDAIPPAESVAAPGYALPTLSQRRLLYDIVNLHRYPAPPPRFLLFDRNVDRVTSNPGDRTRYLALLREVSSSSDHEAVWDGKDYTVFRRNGTSIHTR
jgi:hypothetical protein